VSAGGVDAQGRRSWTIAAPAARAQAAAAIAFLGLRRKRA
jgi:hypothetical protein